MSALLSSPAASGFSQALQPRPFQFPQDHGPHPEYRNEWWYLTGNLKDDRGRRFGYELTIFRFALDPSTPQSKSAWRSHHIYLGHFAITDVHNKQFYVAERFSRGALGLAGARAEPFRVWIDDWQIAASPNGGNSVQWQLEAGDRDKDTEFELKLDLAPQKPPVLNGLNGLSQKSDQPGNASYYYSITRWQVQGQLRIGEEVHTVSGLSWLDREWSSSALADDQQGWDWFALQLSDGSELMLYNLRKTDGRRDQHSAGTWIARDGTAHHLSANQFSIVVTGYWDSPAGGTYPAAWHINVPQQQLALNVAPVMNNQELLTTLRYWEGAVDVSGTCAGTDIAGLGYVELTGYAE